MVEAMGEVEVTVVEEAMVEATEEDKVQQPSPESNDQSSSRPRADRRSCFPST